MVAFKNVEMDDDIAFGAVGGPGWKTLIADQLGGHEVRNPVYEDPRQKWNVTQNIETYRQFELLRAHHYIMRGRRFSFPFHDWTDDRVAQYDPANPDAVFPTLPSPIGGGEGSTGNLQIQTAKRYIVEGEFYDRPIYLIVPGTFQLFKEEGTDGPQEMSSGFSVDLNNGIITIDEDPAGVQYYVICQFRVQVRYDTDEINVSHEDYNNMNWPEINVVETRLEA